MNGSVPYTNQFSTNNAYQTIYGGGISDGFLAKFSPDGLLVWAKFFGDSGADLISGINIDKDDKIYIVGQTSSGGMATEGAGQEELSGASDGFLARFDTNGGILWCTYIGGAQNDSADGVTIDGFGYVYLYGKTTSESGIATPGSYQQNTVILGSEFGSGNDFISKYSESGAKLWCTYYGTNFDDTTSSKITGICVNDFGLYVGGTVVESGSLNYYFATPGCFQATGGNAAGVGADMFLSKFSLAGDRVWSTYYGGSVVDRGSIEEIRNINSVACTRDFVYLTGITNSPNNIVTVGAYQITKAGYSTFVSKFDIDGQRVWGTYLGNLPGGVIYNLNSMVTLDGNGNAFLGGSGNIGDIASPGSYQEQLSPPESQGSFPKSDSYIAKISADGTTRYFGTYYGGTENEHGNRCLLHDTGFYIIGTTSSINYISTAGAHQESFNALSVDNPPVLPTNAFIAKFTEIPLVTTTHAVDKNAVIYPVPNNGTFKVNLNANYLGSTIAIYDISGKKLYQDILRSASQDINCKGISKGTYIVKIANAAGLGYEQKIIVK